jgi:hypothetical protein
MRQPTIHQTREKKNHRGKSRKSKGYNIDAIKCFETCFKWAEENDAPLSDLLVLQRLRQNAYILNQKIVKQKKITDFFFK